MPRSGRCKYIWIFAPIQQGYWTQSVKAKHCWSNQTKVFEVNLLFGLIRNVLPLHFVFSSSQNSNVENILPDLYNPCTILLKSFLKSLELYLFDGRITKTCKNLKSHNSLFTNKMGQPIQLILSISCIFSNFLNHISMENVVN